MYHHACNVAYRKKWMPKNKIVVQPVRGWRPHHIQSHAALTWLYWEEKKLIKTNHVPRITHARNRGERKLVHGQQTFLVDGYDEQTKTVYEFQGCFYNGCLDCFPNHTMRHPIHLNKTMWDVRKQTKIRIQQLSQLGYCVKEMWACEWNHMIQADPQLKEYIHTDDIVTPLNPREDFFGGRTNAIKLYYKVENNEQIHYSDMILLYPCANLECDYPIGHPEFIDQPGTTDISI